MVPRDRSHMIFYPSAIVTMLCLSPFYHFRVIWCWRMPWPLEVTQDH